MSILHWIQAHPAEGAPRLREALEGWGFTLMPGPGEGTTIVVADRPDPRLVPPLGTDILWWVKDATPDPLVPGVPYRLIIEAGKLKAAHDFVPNPRTP